MDGSKQLIALLARLAHLLRVKGRDLVLQLGQLGHHVRREHIGPAPMQTMHAARIRIIASAAAHSDLQYHTRAPRTCTSNINLGTS